MNKLIFLLIFIILIFFGCNVNIKEKVNNCDKISTNFERDRCYLMLADGFVTDNQKQEICKNILNEGTKENCYNIFGIEYQKKAIESNFPIEYVNQSKDYLISKFGGKIFNESIKFERAYSEDDFIYSGECNIQISKAKYGKKYIVEYSFDQSKYIDYPDEFDIFYYPIIVAYDADLGKVYCTDNVVDCINYPTYCPPYKINSYEGAINTFKVKCRDDFTYVGFKGYYLLRSLAPIGMQQSRFLWYFENANYTTRHGELNWAVYLDPQTGDIIDEEGYNSYFEDKTVCLKNAS